MVSTKFNQTHLVFNMTSRYARRLIQSNCSTNVQRPPKSRVSICDYRNARMLCHHLSNARQLGLRNDGQVGFSAARTAGPASRQVQEVKPDRTGNMG